MIRPTKPDAVKRSHNKRRRGIRRLHEVGQIDPDFLATTLIESSPDTANVNRNDESACLGQHPFAILVYQEIEPSDRIVIENEQRVVVCPDQAPTAAIRICQRPTTDPDYSASVT
jgi:hypothetical protein